MRPDAEAVTALGPMLTEIGVAWMACTLDVRDTEQLAGFFDEVDAGLGPVGVLVNIPGGGFGAPALDISARGADAMMRQNFSYVWESCRLAARRMTASGGGSIINVTSIEAHRAMPHMAIYGAMKAAVEHLTRSLAMEWGPDNVRVNTIAPDWFPTAATEALTDENPDQRGTNAGIVVPLGEWEPAGTSRGV